MVFRVNQSRRNRVCRDIDTRATGLHDRWLMCILACSCFRSSLAETVEVTSEIMDVGPARDGGAGCIVTATTSKGWILAGTGLLAFKQRPQEPALHAATELFAHIGV